MAAPNAPASKPNPPSNLHLFFTTETSIQIGWEDNNSNISGFNVEYQKPGTNWSPPISVKANTKTWWHTKLKTGSSYNYRVQACRNRGACSNWTNDPKTEWARKQWDDSSNFNKLDSGLYWFRCGTCRGAGQSDGQPADPNQTSKGQNDTYFDPTKPTVIYVHGWESGAGRNSRESMQYSAAGQRGQDENLMKYWNGWNVGIFYWNQFADDDGLPPPYLAEAKIWTPTSTTFVSQGHGGHKEIHVNMRWRKADGSFTEVGSPKKAVAELFLDAYVKALKGYIGPGVRIVGHSLGNQVVVAMVSKLIAKKYAPIPKRIALLDPYWSNLPRPYITRNGKPQYTADEVAHLITDIRTSDDSISFEYYRTTNLSWSKAVSAQTVYSNLHPDYVPVWDQGRAHGEAVYWYFRSMGYQGNQPTELDCKYDRSHRKGVCNPTGNAAPSAKMQDDKLHTLMTFSPYRWEQWGGRDKPDLLKDTFERIAK